MPIRYRKDGEPDKRQETSMNNLKKSSLYQALQEKKEREKKVVEETPVEVVKKEEPVEVKKEEPPVETKKEEPKKAEPEPVEEVEDEDDDDDDEYEIQVRKPTPPPPPPAPKKEEKPKKKPKKKIIIEDDDDADDEDEVKVVSRKKYDKELTSLKLKNEELKNSLLYGAHLNRLSHVASRQVKLQF